MGRIDDKDLKELVPFSWRRPKGEMEETTACLSAFLIHVEQLADRLCKFALVEGFHEELLDP